jgi:hypothetical protein
MEAAALPPRNPCSINDPWILELGQANRLFEVQTRAQTLVATTRAL